eukprot:TRINITY_DN15099_c1_g1_i2.p1 TRINITY_DN15099_c1_g1~~TRINITY_DN15099_c1_g1_i2.p1  ORF type:complete len:511 (-),score=65.21 TRINITY_DN15099_c1_g1_i2:137-1609(-)
MSPNPLSGSHSQATFVLIGGEAYEWQGVAPELREFEHTSVSFVGSAYASLRAAGVPRSNIVTIVQLQDYLNTLLQGEQGRFDVGIPAKWYAEQRARIEGKCRRLLDEGGANYDGQDVNPSTVWSVLLGESSHLSGPVVPRTGAIVFAIYSHGDSHPAIEGCDTAECFAHFPYPSARADIYENVATNGALSAGRGKNRPQYYLYGTQLRSIFHKIFQAQPQRPVLGLLNYCLSGGNLEFMKRESVRRFLGVDAWPLFLVSSSQPGRDSMVAGMWDAWFRELNLVQEVDNAKLDTTVMTLFQNARASYYQDNLYDLSNAVKARVYVPAVWERQFSFPGVKDDSWDPWHLDLAQALRAAAPKPGGSWCFSELSRLQQRYESGEAFRLISKPSGEELAKMRNFGGVAYDRRSDTALIWLGGRRRDWHGITVEQLAGMDAQPHPVRLVQYSGTQETGACRDLAEVVRHALSEVAQPVQVHGLHSGIADVPIRSIL